MSIQNYWNENVDCIYCLLVDGFHQKAKEQFICSQCLEDIANNATIFLNNYWNSFGKCLEYHDNLECKYHPKYKGKIFFFVPLCDEHEFKNQDLTIFNLDKT